MSQNYSATFPQKHLVGKNSAAFLQNILKKENGDLKSWKKSEIAKLKQQCQTVENENKSMKAEKKRLLQNQETNEKRTHTLKDTIKNQEDTIKNQSITISRLEKSAGDLKDEADQEEIIKSLKMDVEKHQDVFLLTR